MPTPTNSYIETLRLSAEEVASRSYINVDTDNEDSNFYKVADAVGKIADALYGEDIQARSGFINKVIGIEISPIEAE